MKQNAERLLGRSFGIAAVLGLATGSLACGSGGLPTGEEETVTSSAAIHGLGNNPAPDGVHQAVVVQVDLGGGMSCSGTLIGNRTVLTAAHCIRRLGNGCIPSLEEWMASPHRLKWRVSTDGKLSGPGGVHEDYRVDGIVVAPNAFSDKIGECDRKNPVPAWETPRCERVGDPYHDAGLRTSRDIALLRLGVDAGQVEPSDLVTPYPVVTGIDDNNNVQASPGAIHLPLRKLWDAPGWPKRYPVTVTGWGNNDQGGAHVRLAGTMSLVFKDAGWENCMDSGIRCMTKPWADKFLAHAIPSKTILHALRIETVPGSGVIDGVVPASGDSGSPLLLYGAPGMPANQPVVIGALHGGAPTIPDGVSQPPGYAFSDYPATFSNEIGPWIEARLRDWDGDGIDDAHDNCFSAWNPKQENCNKEAEQAARARGETNQYGELPAILGDACDPVPCPKISDVSGSTDQHCDGSSEMGWLCHGRAVADLLTIEPVGAHVRWSQSNKPADRGLNVPNVATHGRFCQDNPAQDYDCHDLLVLRDDRLQKNRTAETERNLPDQPYHRVTLFPQTGGGLHYRGEAFPMDYGVSVAGFRWQYDADNEFWAAHHKIPFPAECGANGFYQGGLYGRGTCLNGVFWTHGDTPVGDTVVDVGGVEVGYNGANLANHYVNLSPDEPTDSFYPGIGVRLPISFIWRTLPDPVPAGPIPHWGRIQNRAVPLQIDADGEKVYRLDDEGYEVDMTAQVSPGLLQKLGASDGLWLSTVEASPLVGAGRWAPGAALLSHDGTGIVDTVESFGGGLQLGSEGGFTDRDVPRSSTSNQPATTTPSSSNANPGPEARSGFVALYSRVANGVFVVGGKLDTNHHQARDAWFRPLDGDWHKIDLEGLRLGKVRAATYSFRDRRLWVLDTKRRGWRRSMRLLRVNPRGGAEVVAKWPYFRMFSKQWLVVSEEGDVMIVASSEWMRRHVVMTVGMRDGRLQVHAPRFGRGALAAAPVVDPQGITWFVKRKNGSMKPVRRGFETSAVCSQGALRGIR